MGEPVWPLTECFYAGNLFPSFCCRYSVTSRMEINSGVSSWADAPQANQLVRILGKRIAK